MNYANISEIFNLAFFDFIYLRNLNYHIVKAKDDSFVLIPLLPDSTYVHQLIKLDTEIQAMIDNKQKITLSEISRICPYSSWREALIALGRYDVIEQIDIDEFINKK